MGSVPGNQDLVRLVPEPMTSPARAPLPRAALVVVTALVLVWAATACTGGGDEPARDDPAETTVPEPATPVLTPDRADPLPVVTPAASSSWTTTGRAEKD